MKQAMVILRGMAGHKFINVFFFKYPPSSEIAPCVGTAGMVQTPKLDAALLSSSRAGADLYLDGIRSTVHQGICSTECELAP